MITTPAQVDLCNQALRALGENPVSLPSDAHNPRWLLVNQFYDHVQDELLLEHAWAFATVRTSLTSATAAPTWGWQYAYALPVDYLAMQRSDESRIFQREGAQLLANDNPLAITYTARVTDVTRWPAYFVSAFVAALAAAFAEQITGQLDKHKVWIELAERRLKRAVELNDLEGSPVQAQSAMLTPPQRALVNQALRPLGELPAQTRFLLGERFYALIWERLLTSDFWHFATKRVELPPAGGVTPAWGFTYAFALPADYLAAQRSEDSQPYTREGDYLLANTTPLAITYTAAVEDVTRWPPYFTAAFVAALTAEFAAALPEQAKNLEGWIKMAENLLGRARTLDGLEASPTQAQSTWAVGLAAHLVNQALRALGDLPRPSRFLLAEAYFDHVRDKLLTAHFWNFATVRTVLTASGPAPASEYAYTFALPADYLSIQRAQTGVRYQREGATFVSDEPTLPLTYTRRVTNVAEWPAQFQTAFVTALTAEIALQIPEAHKLIPAFLQVAEVALKTAKMHDGQEGSPPVLQSRDLIRARFGGWRR